MTADVNPEITPLEATSATRSGSVAVRATEFGLPVAVRIDPRELRYGGADVASTIVEHCRRAASVAAAERRRLLAADGVPPAVLDRLGLPAAAEPEPEEPAPTSWLGPV